MKKQIKVGEYIRTDSGIIGKVIEIADEGTTFYIDKLGKEIRSFL